MFGQVTQEIQYIFVKNNECQSSYQKLISFKSIISKALPNMDKPHIIKLLFDKRHQSLIAFEDNQLIGGVCYANFQGEQFIQIAFLAVRAQKRIQGYGKKIINKLKSHLQSKNIKYMLTYGDNMALGFFRKQGFSQKITMPREKWDGYIKQYDGGKLIQCKIHPTVDYINIESILKQQKQHLINILKLNSTNQVKFDGSQVPPSSQFQRNTVQGAKQLFKRDPRSIPGVIQSGWDWQQHDEIKKCLIEPLNLRCKNLLHSIKKHPQAKYFTQPVSIKQVPTYYKVIDNPMDLHTMNEKVVNEQYANQEQFCLDLQLIFENCKKFNHPDSIYYKSSVKLKQLISSEVQAFKHAVISTIKFPTLKQKDRICRKN